MCNSARLPLSSWPSMVLVVMRLGNTVSALVELDSQGEWRHRGTCNRGARCKMCGQAAVNVHELAPTKGRAAGVGGVADFAMQGMFAGGCGSGGTSASGQLGT